MKIPLRTRLTIYFFLFELVTLFIILAVYYFSQKVRLESMTFDFPFSGVFIVMIKKFIMYNLLEIIIIGCIASLVVLVPVYFIIRKLTYPLIEMKEAIENFSKGDFNLRMKKYSGDEIGQLSDAIGEMSRKMKQQNEEFAGDRKAQMISFIDGQEAERQRLSRELHDGLGQSLVAIKMRLETITHVDMSKIRYVLSLVKDMFDRTLDDIRRMSNDLMPVVLNDFGLETALRTLCHNVEISSHIPVAFTAEKFPLNLEKKSMTYIYRIVQESLTNIVKHSGAGKAEVSIICNENTLVLNIADNGKGFELSRAHSGNGNGLYNIHERVNILHGRISIVTSPGEGTRMIINIPINSNVISK